MKDREVHFWADWLGRRMDRVSTQIDESFRLQLAIDNGRFSFRIRDVAVPENTASPIPGPGIRRTVARCFFAHLETERKTDEVVRRGY